MADHQSVSMDGRQMRAVGGGAPVIRFRQADDLIWGRYSGGQVRLGFLVGTSDGRRLQFRYTQVDNSGRTATGHATERIELLPDGRVRLYETWAWDSQSGSGTSVLEEDPSA